MKAPRGRRMGRAVRKPLSASAGVSGEANWLARWAPRRAPRWEFRGEPQKQNPRKGDLAGVLADKSLTMTYFHRRPSTIIGAKAFHNPVRDGKVWDHLAMVVKRNWLPGSQGLPGQFGRSTLLAITTDQSASVYEGLERGLRCTSILRSVVNNLYSLQPQGL